MKYGRSARGDRAADHPGAGEVRSFSGFGNIELHIEELVLEGFAPHQRYEIAEALRARLGEVLAERGVPASLASVSAIDAGSISFGGATRTGTAAADAIYGTFARGSEGSKR